MKKSYGCKSWLTFLLSTFKYFNNDFFHFQFVIFIIDVYKVRALKKGYGIGSRTRTLGPTVHVEGKVVASTSMVIASIGVGFIRKLKPILTAFGGLRGRNSGMMSANEVASTLKK